MHLSKIVPVLEKIAPPELAADFDIGRIGLNLDLDNDIKKIAVALDPTDYVLNRASEIDADLLITHHTLIFDPVNSISKNLATSLQIALDNRISLYSMHTNFDRAKGGINDILAKRLGLSNVQELEMGRIGEVPLCSTETLANHVSKSLNTHVLYVGERDDIKRVMVFGGSGFRNEYLEIAKEHGVEAFISSELKHDVIRSREELTLIDATHYATENPGMEELCPRLADLLGLDVEFIHHNPFIRVI